MAKIIPEEAYKVYLAYLDDITNSLDLITENLYSRRNQNFNELLQIREKLLEILNGLCELADVMEYYQIELEKLAKLSNFASKLLGKTSEKLALKEKEGGSRLKRISKTGIAKLNIVENRLNVTYERIKKAKGLENMYLEDQEDDRFRTAVDIVGQIVNGQDVQVDENIADIVILLLAESDAEKTMPLNELLAIKKQKYQKGNKNLGGI
mgnify:FL=1